MITLTAADFADTGQWRLILNISSIGFDAFLLNTIHEEVPLQLFCSAKWDKNKDRIRENLEEAVYNNPRLLDDFSTLIILDDPRTLFVPTSIVEATEGAEYELYQKVYTALPDDIMTDVDNDITAIWAMAPGIKSFLMRTFPGARITSNLMNRVKEIRKKSQGAELFAIARKDETDIILVDNGSLISASTHEWQDPDDIAFLSLNLLDIYDYKPENIHFNIQGPALTSAAWQYIRDKSAGFNYKEWENENN